METAQTGVTLPAVKTPSVHYNLNCDLQAFAASIWLSVSL